MKTLLILLLLTLPAHAQTETKIDDHTVKVTTEYDNFYTIEQLNNAINAWKVERDRKQADIDILQAQIDKAEADVARWKTDLGVKDKVVAQDVVLEIVE